MIPLRHVLILLLGVCLLCSPVLGQETAATRETLLDAMDTLWQRYGRQPTIEEIDETGTYTGAQYLRAWETWEAVHQALAEHLYQKGLFRVLGGDKAQAAEYYRRCLEVDPKHTMAREGLAKTLEIDLGQAAKERAKYTEGKAGSEASETYLLFLAAYNQGRNEEAKQYYLRAQRQKETYVAVETQRLAHLYDSAVAAFGQEEYSKAEEQFQTLRTVREGQVGYTEVYQPHAQEITQYLTEARTHLTERRIDSISNVSQNARVMFWATGGFYAAPSKFGLKMYSDFTSAAVDVPSLKLMKGSFFGFDAGASFRLIPSIWAGASWSLMINSPTATYLDRGVNPQVPIDGGSIQNFSFFVQPGGFVMSTLRLYSQVGISFYRVNLPETEVRSGIKFFEHKESPVGFFMGGGADLWTVSIGKVACGLRMDLKYHIVNNKAQTPVDQKLKLNGLRLSGGVVFALGG